ncbi:DUF2982 domain-containing protein [Vibrio sp. Of7-15]|uniref:DUF2982 domain-containing protein n=1 Tax=Vibrio sp. Of7-15 TaxID=2724879 RepID=UPI001EF2344E|nr:DUF2982 domain-containing protein [Vibrio sp. Of7-15]MCG7497078.1 DUF2982 domain-containing protein [Vibrio sp. Of7-15]
MNSVHIKTQHQFSAIGLLSVGVVFVCAAIITLFISKTTPLLVGILFLLGGTTICLSIAAIYNPKISMTLTDMHLQQHTNKGGWAVKWKNIADINHVYLTNLTDSLPWVGIKLHHYDAFLDAICPRMASKIIVEQRILLVMAFKYQPVDKYQLEDILFDDTPYITETGKRYTGLLAVLANRMTYQRELLGFDVYISAEELDRPIPDFIGLARRFLAAAERN